MQQPRQQRTYADLYSQQRSTSSSPVPPGGTRSTATSINGRSGAAAAAHTAASEPGKLQALDAAGSPPKASPRASPKASPKASAAVMAAQQKPSRIPLHPGQAQSPRSGASPGLSPRAGLSTAAHTAGQSSTPWTSPAAVAEAYTAMARHSNGAVVVASPSNGVVAAANGSASAAVSAPAAAAVNQVGSVFWWQLRAPLHVAAACIQTVLHHGMGNSCTPGQPLCKAQHSAPHLGQGHHGMRHGIYLTYGRLQHSTLTGRIPPTSTCLPPASCTTGGPG